jgi:hypothetical protein
LSSSSTLATYCAVVFSSSFSARPDLVLADLAVLREPAELVHRLAADVADRDPGVLGLGPRDLDELPDAAPR